MKYKTKEEIISYINTLQEYQGYVQFSHRAIDKNKDIFSGQNALLVEDEDGFIYEAHFCDDAESIQIRQLNDSWLVSKTDIVNTPKSDIQIYNSEVQGCPNLKMAQIWEVKEDELCENMKVKKLKKVVFAGFAGGEK